MKVIPLEKPLISPIFKKRCVRYRLEIVAVYEGYAEIIFEDEGSVEYLTFEPVKPKIYKKSYHIYGLKDPFSFFTAHDINKIIRTNLMGFIVREEVVEVK